jgi:hypothetical protein
VSDANPFATLGPPPAGDDPRAQLEYMANVLEAFKQAKEPRMKPLRAKLFAAVAAIKDNPAEADNAQFQKRLRLLQLETYDLVMVLVNQIRGTLRVQLKRAMPKPRKLDTEKLQADLGDYALGLRKLISAMKSGDAGKRLEAQALLEKAGQSLDATVPVAEEEDQADTAS